LAVTSWQLIIRMGVQDSGIQCYEWQNGNIRLESWAKESKEELENIGSACTCNNQQ